MIVNSPKRFHPNKLGNAVVQNDGKVDFLLSLVDWIDNWGMTAGSTFCFSKQTCSALVKTLRAQDNLIKDLRVENYDFILTSRMQSDPIDRRFSQYRQMNGGNFLLSFNEVSNSEKNLLCRSLIKEEIDFWKDSELASTPVNFGVLVFLLDNHSNEIAEANLIPESEEVSFFIAGYVAKKIKEKIGCKSCMDLCSDSSGSNAVSNNCSFNLLSRGDLTVPSAALAQYVSYCFVVFDAADKNIFKQCRSIPIRTAAQFILQNLCNNADFICDEHCAWGSKLTQKIVTNIFFCNKQKIVNSSLRKDAVVVFKKRQRTKD